MIWYNQYKFKKLLQINLTPNANDHNSSYQDFYNFHQKLDRRIKIL